MINDTEFGRHENISSYAITKIENCMLFRIGMNKSIFSLGYKMSEKNQD